MRLRLIEKEWTHVGRTLSMMILTACFTTITVSCSQNNDVLITEIGVNPPSRPPSQPSKARDFYIQGQYKHLRGDAQGAIADYTKAINLNPNFGAAYKRRGLV